MEGGGGRGSDFSNFYPFPPFPFRAYLPRGARLWGPEVGQYGAEARSLKFGACPLPSSARLKFLTRRMEVRLSFWVYTLTGFISNTWNQSPSRTNGFRTNIWLWPFNFCMGEIFSMKDCVKSNIIGHTLAQNLVYNALEPKYEYSIPDEESHSDWIALWRPPCKRLRKWFLNFKKITWEP